MREKVDSGILKKYKQGKYSFFDLRKLVSWFQKEEHHHDLQFALEEDWEEFEIDSSSDHKKDLSPVYFKLKQKVRGNERKVPVSKRLLQVYLRAAAILLIPLIIYSTIVTFKNERTEIDEPTWVEITSPYGARTHLKLPDGTDVTLNSGTQLRYIASFQNDRKVEIEGEAFFDVVHNSNKPFIVHADLLNIKVLGTRFSVTSIDEENTIDVILEQGRVQIVGVSNSFSASLTEDESFIYSKLNRSGKIEKVDAEYLTSWKDGYLVFRGEPLGQVMKRLGRWYNVQFKIEDPKVEEFRYRATFQDEPLEEVLRLIALTAPISYEIKERKMDKSNQYDNKTVIIKLNE